MEPRLMNVVRYQLSVLAVKSVIGRKWKLLAEIFWAVFLGPFFFCCYVIALFNLRQISYYIEESWLLVY
jgi:hypothetical protein